MWGVTGDLYTERIGPHLQKCSSDLYMYIDVTFQTIDSCTIQYIG